MREEYFAKEYVYINAKKKTFSSGNFYMILFVTSGKCSYTYDHQTFLCATEDILLVNPNTTFLLEYTPSKIPLKFLQVFINQNSNFFFNIQVSASGYLKYLQKFLSRLLVIFKFF